ncbi:MAG: hypothetical protein PVS3B2_17510 [Candidatus Dormibacteraceae bacterium]
MLLQSLCDVGHAPGAFQVRTESGQPVVDDVGVRVIEPGQHCRTGQVQHLCFRAAQAQQLRPADGNHATAADRKVAMRLQASTPERSDSAPRKNELRFQAWLD